MVSIKVSGLWRYPSPFRLRIQISIQTSDFIYILRGQFNNFKHILEHKTNSVPSTQQYRYVSENFVTSKKSFMGAIAPHEFWQKYHSASSPHESVTNFLFLLIYASLRCCLSAIRRHELIDFNAALFVELKSLMSP